MAAKISVVINTLNEEKYISQAINSVKDLADEVLVCDMHSDDNSAVLAKKLGAKVVTHQRASFVELARNFAISKASGDWILILDPDEEISEELVKELRAMVDKPIVANFVEIPRKNLIFGKWMQASMWWPDYNIRFFKKGAVSWQNTPIHRPPKTEGQGLKLEPKEELAIIHHHYDSISQYLKRLNRYTSAQAQDLVKGGYKFNWPDLIYQPLSEFLGRYFANRGFEDGLHGLALALLQAFSHLIVYLKTWEAQKFIDQSVSLDDLKSVHKKASFEINYWFKYGNLSNNQFKRFFQRVRNKIA